METIQTLRRRQPTANLPVQHHACSDRSSRGLSGFRWMLALIDDDGCFGVWSFSVGGLSVQHSRT
ncbi:hypothetical protein Bca4012_069594 [Brassica carinata]